MFRKLINRKIHWSLTAIILLCVFLFSFYQVNIKAAGLSVFVGTIAAQIPMSVCSNQYTCSSCSMCSCGQWDEDTISPIYGMTENSQFYACKMSSFMPMGTAGMMVGSTIFGYCQSNTFNTYSPTNCNIWSTYNMGSMMAGTASLIGSAVTVGSLMSDDDDDSGGNTEDMAAGNEQKSSSGNTTNLGGTEGESGNGNANDLPGSYQESSSGGSAPPL